MVLHQLKEESVIVSKSNNIYAIPLALFDDDQRLENFNCQTPILDEFLHTQARKSDNDGLTATTIIVNEENDVIGYFTLNIGTQEIQMKDTHSCYPIPFVNLAYLAVDYRHCCLGYGRRIVKYIYKKLVPTFLLLGFSYVFVQSLSDSVGFYKKLGFEMDSKNEKTFEEQGTKLEKYEMLIKVSKIISMV